MNLLQKAKKPFYILLSCALFFGIQSFCHVQPSGFQLLKIPISTPARPEWAVPPLPSSSPLLPLINTALSQPYTFLSFGGQCYAFLSQDGQYVIKFFKMHHLQQR